MVEIFLNPLPCFFERCLASTFGLILTIVGQQFQISVSKPEHFPPESSNPYIKEYEFCLICLELIFLNMSLEAVVEAKF